MSDEKRQTAAQPGSVAEPYFDSEIHRLGADRETFASWCRGATRAFGVAAGAGHTAGATADADVSSVAATGVVPEIVATAIREYPIAGVVVDAERLPSMNDIFDAAACRIVTHHFPGPEVFAVEIARVLEPGGVFAFEDSAAPEDAALAAFLNGVEVLRDPTHVEFHPVPRRREWFAAASLSVKTVEIVVTHLQFDPWTEWTNVSPANRDELERRLREAPGETKELFDMEFNSDSVISSVSPKALVRARTEQVSRAAVPNP